MTDKIEVLWENTFDKSGYGIWGRKCVETLSYSDKYKIGISARGKIILPVDDLYRFQNSVLKNPIRVINLIPVRGNPPNGKICGYCTCTEIKNPPREQIENMNKAKFILALGSHSTKVYKESLKDPEKVFKVNFPIFRGEMLPWGKKLTFKKYRNKFKFLFVGRIDVRKNIKILIDAFKEEFGNNRNVILILKIYSPNYNIPMWIKNKNPSDNIVWFMDKIGDMSLLYRACDAYVTADLGEAWSAPTQEAMLCGLPTIAPRHSGHLDYMNDENSWLVDVGDWEHIGFREHNLYERLLPPTGLVKYPDIENLKSKMRDVYETFKGKSKKEVLDHPKIKKALESQKVCEQSTVFKQLDKALTWVYEKYGK